MTAILIFRLSLGAGHWNDIGNYYGAGVWGVNWRENQFDMHISGGANAGASTSFKKIVNLPEQVKWVNETQSAGKETGDRKHHLHSAVFGGGVYQRDSS